MTLAQSRPVPAPETDDGTLADQLHSAMARVRTELARTIVGQEQVVEQSLLALLAGGNCLLIGVPGLAKTLLIQSLAEVFDLRFSRIQFTPDLMPSDVTGTDVIQEDATTGRRKLTFVHGPIFANLVLADEINRTPPKTQAALLEAMQEHRVTVQGNTYPLDPPFHVFATRNPIELEGTYPLPEAQLDRFLFEVVLDYLPEEDEVRVARETTTREQSTLTRIVTGAELIAFQKLVRRVPVAEPLVRYAVDLARMSRPVNGAAPEASSPFAPARSSATSSSPTRSIALPPRPRRRCSRRCRSAGRRWTAFPIRSRRPSPSSLPRTPSSLKAPIPCPRRNWTGSS